MNFCFENILEIPFKAKSLEKFNCLENYTKFNCFFVLTLRDDLDLLFAQYLKKYINKSSGK